MENQQVQATNSHQEQQIGAETEHTNEGGQSQMQQAADGSPQVKQLQAFQGAANQSAQVGQLMQLQSAANQRSGQAGQMRSAAPVQLTSGPLQLKTAYAKLTPQGGFSKKHLHAEASPELAAAQLVARKYRGWQSYTSTHTVIPKDKFPEAAKVQSIGVGNKSTNALKAITYQSIASDAKVKTAGSEWSLISKNTAKSPAVAGNVSELGAVEKHSNGSGKVDCEYEMSVNHLAGDDKGLNPTTVAWDGTDYNVTINGATTTLSQATVEQ